MSIGRLEPSPRTGEHIHFVAADTPSSNKDRACPKTAINPTKRSLSTVFKRPVFALRANDAGDTPMA
jgi:hypothetical protein